MIRLRIDHTIHPRSEEDRWEGLVWMERVGRRDILHRVIIEQSVTRNQLTGGVADRAIPEVYWVPVEVIDEAYL